MRLFEKDVMITQRHIVAHEAPIIKDIVLAEAYPDRHPEGADEFIKMQRLRLGNYTIGQLRLPLEKES